MDDRILGVGVGGIGPIGGEEHPLTEEVRKGLLGRAQSAIIPGMTEKVSAALTELIKSLEKPGVTKKEIFVPLFKLAAAVAKEAGPSSEEAHDLFSLLKSLKEEYPDEKTCKEILDRSIAIIKQFVGKSEASEHPSLLDLVSKSNTVRGLTSSQTDAVITPARLDEIRKYLKESGNSEEFLNRVWEVFDKIQTEQRNHTKQFPPQPFWNLSQKEYKDACEDVIWDATRHRGEFPDENFINRIVGRFEEMERRYMYFMDNLQGK